MFLTEAETIRTFTKSINRKFGDIENFITNLSVNINSISTQENQNPLVVELLKNGVSALEKQLVEKNTAKSPHHQMLFLSERLVS